MLPITHRTGADAPLSPSRPAVTSTTSTAAAAVTAATSTARKSGGAYPDRPLISSQPVRYNVQLNQQLTAMQQADDFLLSAEKQLLQLNHLIGRRAATPEIKTQAKALQQLLATREQRSGGTVDRQLQLTLQSQPKVTFTLPGDSALLNHNQPELLTFSLAGQQRTISAAALEGASPQHNLLRLNQALGKWGIHGQLTAQQLSFQVEEQRWPQVSQHLSVQGGGERYPQGQFSPLKPQAEHSLEQTLQKLVRTPSRARTSLAPLEQSLDTLTQQRKNLQATRDRVQQRIDSMATFKGRASAVQASVDLAAELSGGGFSVMSQALAGQANARSARVRNVLAAI